MSIVAEFIRPRKALVANRLLVFPQEVSQADQFVAFWWDVTAGVDETRQAAAYKAAETGLQALVLAKDIRKALNFPECAASLCEVITARGLHGYGSSDRLMLRA